MEMVKLLTENGARLNDATQCNDTVLTKALDRENFDMVKYFVSRDADVNQANKKGLTPLLIPESNNDFQTFQYLVDCGAKMTEESQASASKTRSKRFNNYLFILVWGVLASLIPFIFLTKT